MKQFYGKYKSCSMLGWTSIARRALQYSHEKTSLIIEINLSHFKEYFLSFEANEKAGLSKTIFLFDKILCVT